uniref:Uncharacterized protein n=1 Tax=Lepeophtheirus salmonis TaxID=72036 RepID=A0A0K2TM34_LEPSM
MTNGDIAISRHDREEYGACKLIDGRGCQIYFAHLHPEGPISQIGCHNEKRDPHEEALISQC